LFGSNAVTKQVSCWCIVTESGRVVGKIGQGVVDLARNEKLAIGISGDDSWHGLLCRNFWLCLGYCVSPENWVFSQQFR
jgi:hypothetical protein